MIRPRLLALAVALLLPLATVAPATEQDDAAEIIFWESVRDSKVPAEFEAYLKAYPEGKFAPLARIRLNQMNAADTLQKKRDGQDDGTTEVQPASARQAPVQDCDRLAAHPEDPDKVAEGVEWTQIDSARARDACEQAAAAHTNVPRFAFQLGRALHAADAFKGAMTQYRRAAELGYAPAMNGIAILYRSGLGVVKDEAEGFTWMRRAAEKGFPAAMTGLGDLYARGIGVARDDAAAIGWFTKGAEAGHHWAMFNLAVMYRDGRGTTRDLSRAMTWFRKAAEKGNERAMNSLGVLYLRGDGGGQDLEQAVKWFKAAVALGETNAMINLGSMYANGPVDKTKNVSIPKNSEEAADLLFRALRSGNEASRDQLVNSPSTWDADFQRAFQRRLKEAGFYDGAIDGKFGPATRRAIDALAANPDTNGKIGARTQAQERTMVVIVPELNVFEQPSVEAKRIGALSMRDRVVIKQTRTDGDQQEWAWACSDGLCGWVATEFLEAVSSGGSNSGAGTTPTVAIPQQPAGDLPDLKGLGSLD